jgi:hypothetical protein
MNLTSASVSTAIWIAQGAPVENNCVPQALLVDVSAAINPWTSPNRTQWAQSALLWNLVQSQNLSSVQEMRTFILNAPWSRLAVADGAVPDNLNKFNISVSGFTFDFAAQTVSQPNITFISDGQPTNAQISQVGGTAQNALDRMYSYALGMIHILLSKDFLTYRRSVVNPTADRNGDILAHCPTAGTRRPGSIYVCHQFITDAHSFRCNFKSGCGFVDKFYYRSIPSTHWLLSWVDP